MRLLCRECNHSWFENLNMPMTLAVLSVKLDTVRCPKCGGKKILIPICSIEGGENVKES